MSNMIKNLCDELIENTVLDPVRVDEIANKLLDAPNDPYIPLVERANAILLHSNISRSVYDRILNEVPYAELAVFSNTLHLLLINDNTTLEDIQALKIKADEHNGAEWFRESITTSLAWSEYQLILAYNGTLMVQDKEERSRLMKTVVLLSAARAADSHSQTHPRKS